MNIFVLHSNPKQAAQSHCDKHVGKLLLESVQMLSTVAHKHGGSGPYRSTHATHPCTLWVAESRQNWIWLVDLAKALREEFHYRYDKHHASGLALDELQAPDLPNIGLTPHAQAMPDEYRVPHDAVAAYRHYYRAAKANFAKWERGREAPSWWNSKIVSPNSSDSLDSLRTKNNGIAK